jgi:formate/nitrite transporter FocA (FNT family)
MIVSFKKEEINISSKRKWFIVGIIIALLNPIFSGLVIAYAFLTEPKLRKEGKIILIISFVWAIVLAYLIEWLKSGGYI